MGRGISAECMTSRTARNSTALHSWEVFHNVDTPTSRWDDHARSPGPFALVYPRPAIPRPWSYRVGSVLDRPASGPSERDVDRFPDVEKCAVRLFHNS